MRQNRVLFFLILILLFGVWSILGETSVQAARLKQQPTVAIPTVTSTSVGPTVIVSPENEQINVRSGPGTEYDKIGVLISGQEVPALGRSAQGLWIQIAYPGVPGSIAWVYAFLVSVPTGELSIVAPPPTPTPRVTPTIDPTLAAQFIQEIPATRLPTYTPPPPIVVPTFEVEGPRATQVGLPMGMMIIGLGVLGVFGAVVSFLRGR